MDRTQMTFFVSFWDAINSMSKKDQLPIFRAVISYGLFGEHRENLSPAQCAFFSLMQPVLDSSRRKAANGKQGGSKQKANRKQTEREKENEIEIENEIEYECKKAQDFESFWEAYPRKVGKAKAEAAFQKLSVPVEVLISAIAKQKKSAQWTKDGGQFIPHPTTWLNRQGWEDELAPANKIPMGATGELGQAELEAIARIMREP